MLNNKDSGAQLGKTQVLILATLVLLTLIFGVYGFQAVYVLKPDIAHPHITRWFDVAYSTIKLFSLISSPADEKIEHWAVSIARFTAGCSVLFSLVFAALYAARNWLRVNIFVKYYKNHYIVFGLNNSSAYLIDDLLREGKKVIVVENDFSNPLIPQFKTKKVPLMLGDASSLSLQLNASILSAHAIVVMTESDLFNLDILKTLVDSSYSPNLHCHIRLDNMMSYKLFEPGAFYSIEKIKQQSSGLLLNVFNLNERSAIELVQTMQLGYKKDHGALSTQPLQQVNRNGVSILLVGFTDIGQAVLRELLLLAHFSHHVKTKIVIVGKEHDEFFITHHQVLLHSNGRGLDLWDIKFVESYFDLKSLSAFDHIISASEDEDIAVKEILRIYDLCTFDEMQATDFTTSFHYYNANNHDIKHQQIRPFGSFDSICSDKQIFNSQREVLARRSHELYAKAELGITESSHEIISEKLAEFDKSTNDSNKWLHWVNQPLFKRQSSFTEKRHIIVKLGELAGEIPNSIIEKGSEFTQNIDIDFPYLSEFSDLDGKLIKSWLVHVQTQLKMSSEELTEHINNLAEAEHNRWNAFHIVNNWRYGEQKDELLKTHDCLLSWKELLIKKADTIKYDYKNIYQIPESIAVMNAVRQVDEKA